MGPDWCKRRLRTFAIVACVVTPAAIIPATPRAAYVNSLALTLGQIPAGTFEMGMGSVLLPQSLLAGPSGVKTGVETWWSEAGRKQWERAYAADGVWTWRLFDSSVRLTAESRWKGRDLLEVTVIR